MAADISRERAFVKEELSRAPASIRYLKTGAWLKDLNPALIRSALVAEHARIEQRNGVNDDLTTVRLP